MDAHTHWHRTDLQHRILYSSHYGKLQQAAIYHLFTNNGKFMHRTNLQSFSHRSITKFIQQSVWSNTIYINHKIANTHPSFQLCVCVCVCVCVYTCHTHIYTQYYCLLCDTNIFVVEYDSQGFLLLKWMKTWFLLLLCPWVVCTAQWV